MLVEALQRLHRVLSEPDRARYAELLAPYVEKSAGQYTYRVKGKEAIDEHLGRIGAVLQQLVVELAEDYADDPVFQMLQRIFEENYTLVGETAKLRLDTELNSMCLQSVDDLEATFRRKGPASYKGYVANLAETCDPENEVQLITSVQVAPNNQDDAQLLAEALPDLKQRTGVEELYTDGGFGSPAVDQLCQAEGVEQFQTAIRGNTPSPDKHSLAYFSFVMNDQGRPEQITCPHGQTVAVLPARTTGFFASFDACICQTCPFQSTCPAKPVKRQPAFRLNLTLKRIHSARRRRRSMERLRDGKNPRAAVEACMRSVKHPFRHSKAPVRGLFRITCLVVASAIMVNTRRIHRYLTQKRKDEDEKSAPQGQTASFLPPVWNTILARFAPLGIPFREDCTCFSF